MRFCKYNSYGIRQSEAVAETGTQRSGQAKIDLKFDW